MSASAKLRQFVAFVCLSSSLWAALPARAQSFDTGFKPVVDGGPRLFAVQPDGKIIIAPFLAGLRRVNRDGSPDFAFVPTLWGAVHGLAVQADGKILVAGDFRREYYAATQVNLVRLNADGSFDETFNPIVSGPIYATALQPDGKVVVGGLFPGLRNETPVTVPPLPGPRPEPLPDPEPFAFPTRNIGRVNTDGSVDTAFVPSANGAVLAVAVQPDGKIVIGGAFFELWQAGVLVERKYVARLHVDGSVDLNFNPGTDDTVIALALQADGKILIGGEFSRLGDISIVPRQHIGRVHADGSLDTDFVASADGNVEALLVQPDGRILVGGAFSYLDREFDYWRPRIARLDVNGSVDQGFAAGANDRVVSFALQPDGNVLVAGLFTRIGGGGNGRYFLQFAARLYPDGSPDLWLGPRPNASVFTVAVQPDGGILLGGGFNMIHDPPAAGSVFKTRNRIARLQPDGSLDDNFDPDANGTVRAIAVQSDGKIVIGGFFTSVGGVPRNYVARLNRDGTVDESFDAQLAFGAVGAVFAIALHADGDIVIGGIFSSVGGAPRVNLARIHSNGAVHPGFSANTNGAVHTVALQRDGKTVIGGSFSVVAGVARSRLARLNVNGSPDTWSPGANGTVNAVAVQLDGKVIAAGEFTILGGGTRRYVGRLTADGVLDADFDSGATGYVRSLALQTDGKLLVAGPFSGLGGRSGTVQRIRIGRFNLDGSVDATFDLGYGLDPGLNDGVSAIALQADGKIVVAQEQIITRLRNTGSPHQEVTLGGGTLSWLRSDSVEVSRVTFDLSTDGTSYVPLGEATRIGSDWRLGRVTLPFARNVLVRARGYFSSGLGNGSSSIVESVRTFFLRPQFTDDPLIPRVSYVKAVHISELRARVNELRARHSLPAFGWGAGAVIGGTVRAQHIIEIRAALGQVYNAVLRGQPTYADSNLAPGAAIKAIHITELRAAVIAAESF